MTATISLLLGLGFGRAALVADLVLTGAFLAGGAAVVARARRVSASTAPAPPADAEVVAAAEAVVSGADHQPA